MAKSDTIRVLLIRSGANEWDQAGRIVGSADLPLSPDGRGQMASVAARVAGQPISVVYSAPDEGSRTSARMVAEATGAKVRVLDDLTDVRMGLWEGMLKADLEEKSPTAFRQWKEDPLSVGAPEGEPLAEARDRILSELARALERTKGSSLSVGVVLRPVGFGLARCWLAGAPCRELWRKASDGESMEWHTVWRAWLKPFRQRIGVEA